MSMGAKRTVLTILLTVVGTLILCVAGTLAVAYSGTVDVAATKHPSGLTSWFLGTTRDHSIHARAQGIAVPGLDAPRMLEMGADHYKEMCVGCHGAPGVEAGEAAQGLEPAPPVLYRGPPMTKEDAAETFWVVKNGIQMTGMPAFGKTHDDDKLWAIVAFMKRLNGMSPEDYQKATAAQVGTEPAGTHAADEHAEPQPGGHEHGDGAGSPEQR